LFSLTDYSYELPEGQIAQKPADQRDQSRLLRLDRGTGNFSHHKFQDIYDFLRPSDLLVINNTKVIPARLRGKKDTGGKVELLISDYGEDSGLPVREREMTCLIKTSKNPKPGSMLFFEEGLSAEIITYRDGISSVKFSCPGDFEETLYRIGEVPLPPYIKRDRDDDAPCDDRAAYQTVYASQKGAVAAPTAGLHFSESLLEKIRSKGVKAVAITLHVGYGTFLPVRVSDIREHRIHAEWYSVSETAADAINRTKAEGGRVVAVGTTSVRTLEYASDSVGKIRSGSGKCDLFIYPGYSFKITDAMITNFHLPESTLLMLVSAFAGRENLLKAYKEAVSEGYRFYSYGDAMFIC